MPISFSMIAENTPIKQRGTILALIGIFYTLGELLVCFFAYFTLGKNIEEGNWRVLLLLSSLSALLIVIGVHFYIEESPRFLLLSGNFEDSFKIIEIMAKQNKKYDFLLEAD